jgi:putative endonuclease
MYYVYVLKSEKDVKFYTGFTVDLKRRVSEHNAGRVRSTATRRPLKLVYYEGCLNQADAIHREKYLKTTFGKQYIKNRMKNYLSETG